MFAQATSRITSDLVHYIFHYLRSMSLSSASSSSSSSTSSSSPACEVFQAPYLATAQMAYFASCGLLDAIIGPPSLLLFGIPRVIVSVDWKNEAFEWVELQQLLTAWSTDKEQFVDACLLAGTEYCLTFPYLNLNQFHHGQNKFTFGTAIEFIKQAPLVSYMQHFPSAEMKNDHVDGYCVCKALIHYPVIMQLDGRLGFLHQQGLTPPTLSRSLTNGTSSAAPAGASPLQRLPNDYNRIVGSRLPSAVYVLLAEGFLSRKLPAVLALGEWIDASQPAVDSIDYRELLNDVQDYRARALGLLAMRLPAQFRQRQIHFCRYSCTNSGSFERSTVGGSSSETDDSGCSNGDTAVALPRTDSSVFKCWNITAESVKNELKRQGHEKVDVLFCLKWHAHSREHGLPLFDPVGNPMSSTSTPDLRQQDRNSLVALVLFILLDNLGYFAEGGGGTVFGDVLSKAPKHYQEELLFVQELLKFGYLSGDALVAPDDRPYPSSTRLFSDTSLSLSDRRSLLFLSRLCSLIPMRLRGSSSSSSTAIPSSAPETAAQVTGRSGAPPVGSPPGGTTSWGASPVDFDLAGFHALVKVIRRSLRQLVEAALCNLLLREPLDLKWLQCDFFSPTTPILPSFPLPRNCMGIVLKFILEYPCSHDVTLAPLPQGITFPPAPQSLAALDSIVRVHFPLCEDPIGDVCAAMHFWVEALRMIRMLSPQIDVGEPLADLAAATTLVVARAKRSHLTTHPLFPQFLRSWKGTEADLNELLHPPQATPPHTDTQRTHVPH
eukprot:GHVT01099613.1.p1 GENE.GHVT01099613.1~~GHVT01099613.1.p1  ORF type:complete len:776 (+),score=105.72 GHVT01099613.1:1571-3898(+)